MPKSDDLANHQASAEKVFTCPCCKDTPCVRIAYVSTDAPGLELDCEPAAMVFVSVAVDGKYCCSHLNVNDPDPDGTEHAMATIKDLN